MNKIYTKNGDKGYTNNLLGKKYFKGDMEIELQGQIDAINAKIGFLRSLVNESLKCDNLTLMHINEILKKIQYDLYLLGIEVSTEFTEIHISENTVKLLEDEIDYLIDNTTPMDSFIYYFGSKASTFSHIIRATARECERTFARVLRDRNYPISYKYINRLSDYFFVLSRYLNHIEGISDEALNYIRGE